LRHEDVHSGLFWIVGLPVENRNTQYDHFIRFPPSVSYFQDGLLAVKFGLTIHVWGIGGRFRFVGSFTLAAREDVIRGDVDKKNTTRCSDFG
jgi:hypothetical protein